MAGFRFRGRYLNPFGIYYAAPVTKVASLTTHMPVLSATASENWYAVFGAGDGDTDSPFTFRIMPFLRAGTVTGSNVQLVAAGEGQSAPAEKSYAWTASNNLAGTDLLVISENGAYSGRVTQVTANSASQITLADIGTVATGDTFLPAPPDAAHYGYICSFYRDTAEVRNIYDTGTLVKSKGIYVLNSGIETGSVAAWTLVNTNGYICPLATGVVLDANSVLSTASLGSLAEYFSPDSSSHTVQSEFRQKSGTAVESVVFSNVQIPFLYPYHFYYSNAGTLAASRITGRFHITGWFEP
jgi:hypothetical protein